MAEKISKTPLRDDSLSVEIKKIETLSKKYIDQAVDSTDKQRRKKIVISTLKQFPLEIGRRTNCPRGTHWDPISMTCVPD